MLSIASLINRLRSDYPDFNFTPGENYLWNPSNNTVFYRQSGIDYPALIHELSHAILGHKDYKRDIELVEMECKAWDYARQVLSKKYNIPIRHNDIDDHLDTYRDWLHARSTCPNCVATGIETKKHRYKCVVCNTSWRVNDARICMLRRNIITP
jgi:hypothetical protein